MIKNKEYLHMEFNWMKLIKNILKSILASSGYGVFKLNPHIKREVYNAHYMGDCFKCIKGDPLTEDILQGRGWDNQVPEILNSIKSGTVVEIGANIGTSILPHSSSYPHLQFALFEPVPVFYKILEENHKIFNKKSNVQISQLAFGAEKNQKIEINIGLGTAGKTKLVHYQMKDASLIIESNTLDNIFNNTEVSLIKIDVDGHELSVLQGGKQILNKQHPLLFLEFAPRVMKDIGQSPTEITKFLRDLGYDQILIWDHDSNFIKTTNDWEELVRIGIEAPHYLNILVKKLGSI